MENLTAVLDRSSLFEGVGASEVQAFLASIAHSKRTHQQGARLFSRGDPCDELLILLHGELSTVLEISPDKSMTIETLRAPDAIASGIVFAQDNSYPVTGIAATDLGLLAFPRSSVLALCARSPRFLENYLEDMGNKIVFLAEKIRFLKFTTLRQKVAAHLLDLVAKQGRETVRLPFSKEALAEVFGVARPSLSRVFSELNAEGVIVGEGRQVEVRRIEVLKTFLESGD